MALIDTYSRHCGISASETLMFSSWELIEIALLFAVLGGLVWWVLRGRKKSEDHDLVFFALCAVIL